MICQAVPLFSLFESDSCPFLKTRPVVKKTLCVLFQQCLNEKNLKTNLLVSFSCQ
jgi:hypothetical protein